MGLPLSTKIHGKKREMPICKEKIRKDMHRKKRREKNKHIKRDGIMPDSLPVPHEPISTSCPWVPWHSIVSSIVLTLISVEFCFLKPKALTPTIYWYRRCRENFDSTTKNIRTLSHDQNTERCRYCQWNIILEISTLHRKLQYWAKSTCRNYHSIYSTLYYLFKIFTPLP